MTRIVQTCAPRDLRSNRHMIIIRQSHAYVGSKYEGITRRQLFPATCTTTPTSGMQTVSHFPTNFEIDAEGFLTGAESANMEGNVKQVDELNR